jgi:hypothetical protein
MVFQVIRTAAREIPAAVLIFEVNFSNNPHPPAWLYCPNVVVVHRFAQCLGKDARKIKGVLLYAPPKISVMSD